MPRPLYSPDEEVMSEEQQKKVDECTQKIADILAEYGMKLHIHNTVSILPAEGEIVAAEAQEVAPESVEVVKEVTE